VCGIGCLIAGIFANLPFIIAPPTAVSIFYSVFIRQNDISVDGASSCVIVCGGMLVLFGYRPLGRLATKVNRINRTS
jgi:xanthine/uracil/vitamin C permease (AzgA family)